ncbi:MAG: hypothetical protein QG604_465 [Candidatus Dependentiae bacterium]|nr:hypothetical protein [Candidatus Dependentiae bacterium]
MSIRKIVWCIVFMNVGAVVATPIDYGHLLADRITFLQATVEARQNSFHLLGDAANEEKLATAVQLLVNVQKNIALLGRDQAYPEVAWFLELVTNTVGDIGQDVANNRDISSLITELKAWVGPWSLLETRVWSTTFCFLLMQRIFDELAQALELIVPLPAVVTRSPAIVNNESPTIVRTETAQKRAIKLSSVLKKALIISGILGGSCVIGVVAVNFYTSYKRTKKDEVWC